MIIITVRLLRAELIDFSIKEETSEINIWFTDGKDEHKLAICRKIANSEELAEQMITEIRKIVKNSHTPESNGYDEILAIKFENEDDAVKKLQKFFERVKDKIREVRLIKSSQGYLDTLTRAKKLELEF